MLSRQLIEELQQIIREEYGRFLTQEETFALGADLVGYFDLLAQIKHRSITTSDQEVISESSKIKLTGSTS